MATSDVGVFAQELAESLAKEDDTKGVYVLYLFEFEEIINTLKACATEIDAAINGGT